MPRLLALLLLFASATAHADRITHDAIAGGEHWRIQTDAGAIHVWRPAGYNAESAGVAVYVHGYYTDVDKAWSEHSLAEQFRASGRNALFVAPEAPSGTEQAVQFPCLAELLRTVQEQTGVSRPWGKLVIMVHSGGYRTALAWLEDGLLEELVLLDALYGGEEEFLAWLKSRSGERHRLVLVAADTLRWTEPFVRAAGGARTRVGIPESPDGEPNRAADQHARLFYLLSQFGHMPLVTGGKAIPALLRLSALPALGAGEGKKAR
jgi:hypothetical protein